ncbi:U-Kazal-Dg21.2-like [Nymphalis io]|uniref:U-Kazal-Dg21.2-like n=1 Tax=Inachis io TaxID=171585 RepID=UPI00216A4E88|nr:U-Kazal-Dg21.2-like [Nymphalis io]
MSVTLVLLFFLISDYADCARPTRYNHTRPSSKYNNPNFIRDRYLDEIWKPMMDETWVNRFNKLFNPTWMDYCDPYHCNDYHKIACGLNRKTMRFKWFQSGCHIILHNKCANYRGNLKYDMVDTNFCMQYVMFLRNGCPSHCPDDLDPVCGASSIDKHVVLFKNKCFFERANCQSGILEEYEKVDLRVCSYVINL